MHDGHFYAHIFFVLLGFEVQDEREVLTDHLQNIFSENLPLLQYIFHDVEQYFLYLGLLFDNRLK